MDRQEIDQATLPSAPVGLFYAWWCADSLPDLSVPSGLTVQLDPPADVLGQLTKLPAEEIAQRFERGNRAVIGRVDGQAAASGWAAAGRVQIGELGLDFRLPPANRYLWDFVTLPAWRGRGLYPALLRAFIEREPAVERFWVGHDLDNVASSRGILKTGFKTVGEVYIVDDVGPVFVARGAAAARAPEAAELLGLPLAPQDSTV